MFILEGKAEIGDYIFNALNEVEITKSVEELGDTAVIKIPTAFKVKQNGQKLFVEDAIKVGDAVKITLGYQDKYSGVEFTGFVKKISPKIPIEIHCEDNLWLLRRKNITKSFEQTTMKEILKEVVKDTPIQLADNIPEVKLEKWIINNANGAQVLESFKKDLLMSVFIDDDGKLYCGLQQLTNVAQPVVYDLNYNLVENNLEFKSKEERKIKIKYTYIDKANKRKSIEVGDADGEQRTYHTTVISDEKKLEEMAKAEIEKLKYDGFDGNVKSFLIPYSTRGMKAKFIDSEHPNREGNYFIKKVVTSFGTSGARRTVTIGARL
ncbi:late control protein [Flavobacterium jejuense]|uniref:Late control protein n=1 Tax=Flavobacterium jejuense TaxID=1544455 RepID=A0ABX0IYB8_9FLAO|nr:late control protein [Flavobacterium jejuense]NHN26754.1 late control protein [Flavobacterium jejuense]